MEKKYNHKIVENDKYNFWLTNDLFKAGDLTKEPFCIVIPPPNVTGKLHLGHAWDTTLQDVIIRYKKMNGYDTLWLPGMDHAGIATQAKVDNKLKQMGINPREMKREEWLKKAWDWKEEYADSIHNQWAKLGLSLDYSRERFTLDKGLSEAVKYVFVTLYNKGLIYKGERIINWDPEAMTALSNEEVIYKDVEGAFYYIKYIIEGTDDYLTIATTRPETLFGDTAVAVNPKDKRYNHLIGKNVILPIVDKAIPIIGDNHANMEFGTGVVKITPAHDQNDFEVGNRHNLERIRCINENGKMNENAGVFNGLDRFQCREKVIELLKEKELLIKVEKMVHSVGHSERTEVMVEPYLSKQWFVKMKPLADHVIENQKTDDKVNFIPKRFEKILLHWMEIAHDWCISRQLWWGHRIPAWYKGEEIYVGMEAPKEEGWIQDSDVLDTWFSSALWPFSTLGWPKETEDLKRYFPNNVLVTGYDIIFFWVCKMVFQSLEFTDERPFDNVLIHGLIRDKQGRKMSKSLGNGVDPMDVIDNYGADALRFFLSTTTSPGQDLRYDEEKIKATWNFVNKLWNASRFVFQKTEGYSQPNWQLDNLSIYDKWILTKLNKTIKDVRKAMDKYEFNNAGSLLYNFIWNDYCDWYIEFSKANDQNDSSKEVLLYMLSNILRLMHPFMPYVTEELYQKLPIKKLSIMIDEYPKYNAKYVFNDDLNNVNIIIELIKKVRNIKLTNNIPKESELLFSFDGDIENLINNNIEIISKILKNKIFNSKEYQSSYSMKSSITFEYGEASLYYESSSNEYDDKNRLEKEKEDLISSINRRQNLLANEGYVNKAPAHIVDEEKRKLNEETNKLNVINEKLKL